MPASHDSQYIYSFAWVCVIYIPSNNCYSICMHTWKMKFSFLWFTVAHFIASS